MPPVSAGLGSNSKGTRDELTRKLVCLAKAKDVAPCISKDIEDEAPPIMQEVTKAVPEEIDGKQMLIMVKGVPLEKINGTVIMQDWVGGGMFSYRRAIKNMPMIKI
mmetsp:Transcript_11351/g.16521  ORF Transcript_11351/g.16521 Transcript_11351/m.16521 type:complete len:106 (-) Transcript_11351:86-403(-)